MENGELIPLEDLVYATDLEKAYGITEELHRFYSDQQRRLARFDEMPQASFDEKRMRLIERSRAFLAEHGFDPTAQNNIFEAVRVDFVHSTTAIEGNTLSAGDVALVLSEGAPIPGKPERDRAEVADAACAFDAMVRAVKADRALDVDLICELHAIIAAHLPDCEPGELRWDQRYVVGAATYPFPAWRSPFWRTLSHGTRASLPSKTRLRSTLFSRTSILSKTATAGSDASC